MSLKGINGSFTITVKGGWVFTGGPLEAVQLEEGPPQAALHGEKGSAEVKTPRASSQYDKRQTAGCFGIPIR